MKGRIYLNIKKLTIRQIIELKNAKKIIFESNCHSNNDEISDIIESILLYFPIKNIYAEVDNLEKFTIIDGNNFLDGIFDFIDNKFELCDMEFFTEFNGKKFSELPWHIRSRILETELIIYGINVNEEINIKHSFKRRIKEA
jgi:hypothetical protein